MSDPGGYLGKQLQTAVAELEKHEKSLRDLSQCYADKVPGWQVQYDDYYENGMKSQNPFGMQQNGKQQGISGTIVRSDIIHRESIIKASS